MSKVYPILLAGGSGTRLWPLSRKTYPKQFSKLLGDKSLFQDSAGRLVSSKLVEFFPHVTMTNSDFRFITVEQLQGVGIDPGPILIEPEKKNTAAAILAASIFVHSSDPEAVLLVSPSDHVIPDTKAFHKVIKIGLSYVNKGKIVTFGINPTHPDTGYGYLELSTNALDSYGTSDLKAFVEKPEMDKAEQMLANGNFLWNAGIFLFRAQYMIDAFKTLLPETFNFVSSAVNNASTDLGFLRLGAVPWSMLKDISIDYAIMEKVENLVAIPYMSKWSDLGGWDAVWSEGIKDTSGNVTSNTTHALNCTNTLLRSEDNGQQVVGLGLDNVMAIAMPDAVLIAHKDQAQDVKKAVALLKSKNITQAEIFPKDYRPWGSFKSLILTDRFQVKYICVKPGGSISLQSHKHRSEHWVVVAGIAKITIDENVKFVKQGESVYVPLGAKHRMENHGKVYLNVIEVQLGNYLGEDDIVRYEDGYGRI